MKTLFILVLALLFHVSAFSQHVVTGLVKDSTGEGVPFATLRFYEGSSTAPETGKIADSSGAFKVQVKSTGSYTVKVSALGYRDTSIQFTVAATQSKLTLVMGRNSHELKGITIASERNPPLIQRKIDRVIMNVSNNPLATGKSSLELFQLAPGVFVNNGRIAINGVWGTRIMINGKMLHLSGSALQNYLNNLKANDIQAIEVIEHPGAEYDAEGSGGIINIILKKNANNGWNGYVGANYSIGLGKYPSYDPFFAINFKRKKLTLSTSYAYDWSKSYQQITQNRELSNGMYNSNSLTTIYRSSHQLRLSASYDITNDQYIAVNYSRNIQAKYRDTTDNITQILYPDEQENTFSNGSFSSTVLTNYSDVGINYHLSTDTLGSYLSIIGDYTYNKREKKSGSFSKTYDIKETLTDDTSFYSYFPSTAKIWTADINYQQAFKSGINLSFGGKMTLTNIDNHNSYDIFNNGKWENDPGHSFSYLYKENVYAGFINLSGSVLKIDYKIGLRGEKSEVNGIVTGSGQDTAIKRNYFDLFPAVFLKKDLDAEKNHTLNLSYNRRIERPSYFELNPYKYYLDNYSIVSGNPYLKPEFTDKVELGYTLRKKYYFGLSYTHTKDIINQVIENDPEEKIMLISRQNTGSTTIYSAKLSIPVSISNWWNTNNNLLLSHTQTEAPEFHIEKSSFILQSQQDFRLTPTFSMSLGGFYTPGITSGNLISTNMTNVEIAVQKKLSKNRLTLKAAISDLFYTNNLKVTAYYKDSKIFITQKNQTRKLSLSLVYNFSGGEKFKKKDIENSNTAQQSRLK